MATQAETLAELQELDMRVLKLQRELQDIPLRQKAIEVATERKQESLKEAKGALQAQQAAVKKLELEVEAEREKIRRFREQQLQLKTNKEFRAMEDEISSTEARIARVEDQQLAALEKVEEASRTAAGARANLEKAEAQVRREVTELQERAAKLQAELAAVEGERNRKAPEVDPRWLRRYEPIFQNRKDRALVRVEHGVCGGCHMTLAPHVVHDARRGDLIVSCSFCGRLLY